MHISDLFPISTLLTQLASAYLQFRYNKAHKSIYGLSYDYSLLQLLAHTTSILGILGFHSSTITTQYRIRWLMEPPSILLAILVIEILSLIASLGVMIQLITYKSTRGSDQGVSGYCMGFIIAVSLPLIYLIKLWLFNQAKINDLDVVDYIWAMQKMFDGVQYIPQIMVNLMDDKVNGLHPYWKQLQFGNMAIELVEWIVYGHGVLGDLSFIVPSLPLMIIKDLSLLVVGLQYYLYRHNQPEVHYKEV